MMCKKNYLSYWKLDVGNVKNVMFVLLMCVCIVSLARAELVITNGDFETGAGVNQSIADVTDWYDNNAGGFWEDAWQTNVSGVTPNGSNVVVFCSWDAVEGDPLAGSYLYQSIGTSTGESSITLSFDWGHPDDTAADRYDGLTVSVLASDGSFVADDANDVLGAAGITLLDYASYDHVALGTDGEIFPVEVTLDISGANAGDEIFLRFNNYMPEAGADPWPVLDNVQLDSVETPSEEAEPKIVYVDATEGEGGNTTLADGGVFNSTGDASGSDNLWRGRAFGNSATIFESGGSYGETANPEDCPRLKTSVDVPEGNYNVYVYFWSDGSPWCVQASLTDSEGDLPLYVAGQGDTTTAAAEDFAEPVPMLTEDNRTLWQVSLGSTGSTTTIDVYIDDLPNHLTHNSRTWYDGIGYEEIVPEKIWREAEAADSITTPFQVVNDATASGGNYIVASSVANNSNPPSTGIAKYGVEITEEGVYRMYLRVRCETAGDNDDSCYVRIRGAALNLTGLNNGWISDNNIDYQVADSTDWFWKQVGNYSNYPGNDYAEFTMTPGTYTVEIAYREDGLDIDGFLLTNATDIDPAALPDVIPVGPLVIGDFESGLDGWWRWYDSSCTMEIGTVGATSGSSSLDLTVPGGYYQIAWSVPTGYGLDLSNVTTLQLDAAMIVADFPPDTWTKIAKIAINSELGWREVEPTLVVDNGTGQEVPNKDWGTWGGAVDSYRTITWDIAAEGLDWTGFGDSSYQEIAISAQGNGVFHFDNIRLNGAQLIAKPLYPAVKLDINASDDPGETQNGFTPFVLADSNSITVDDISVTLGGYDPADAYRLSEPNDVENEDIYKDFILAEQSEPGVGYVTLTLEGLEPNAPYNIKIYSWDSDISGLTVTDWLANYEYLLTTTQDGNSVPPAADDQAFSAYANADPNGVILMEAVPGEGIDPNAPFAVLNALVLSALHAPPVTSEVTSDADTWTVSGDPNSHGMDEYMVIHGGSIDRTGYVRFDLSGLDIDSIKNATLTLSVHGTIPKPPYRNDSVVSGRFALYGLNNVIGNTLQDWGEDVLTSSNTGVEMDWATGSVITDGGLATDLDDDVEGISETYSEKSSPANASLGATISISGDALVSFLQSRVDDGGLATFILKDDDGSDRGYGLCSKEYPDPTYWPKLDLEYLEK